MFINNLDEISALEIKFFKKFNPLKRKQKDTLVASALLRLDSNLILRSANPQHIKVDLVETVDFHIQEALKAKFQTILQESYDLTSKEYLLNEYLDLKHKKHSCWCCFEIRTLSDRKEFQTFKTDKAHDVFKFKAFCDTYGPFAHKNKEVFSDINALSNQYRTLKKEYDEKEVTIPEKLGTLEFNLEVLRTEEDYLRIRRLGFEQEMKHNEFEVLFLKEKVLHIKRLWGTLGVLDSLNFFKNFSVCIKTYERPNIERNYENNAIQSQKGEIDPKEVVHDDPLMNLERLKNYKKFGETLKEVFHWIPKAILLMAILISFCRPDFLSVIIFTMIGSLTKFRWLQEHYYSAIFAVFCLVALDVFWY